jgi:hypothetical protein
VTLQERHREHGVGSDANGGDQHEEVSQETIVPTAEPFEDDDGYPDYGKRKPQDSPLRGTLEPEYGSEE